MDAPKEIYIYREPPKDYFEDGWGESKVDDMESIAYVRKESIMDFLKKRLTDAEFKSSCYPYEDWYNSEVSLVKELIEELESLGK